MKKLGAFLLAKDSNAIIVAFLAALLPIFYIPTGIIAVVIVGLVTLQKGPKSGFWLLTWIALPTIAFLVLKEFGLSDVLLARCVIVWLFASLMYRYHSWRVLLLTVAMIGISVVGIAHWYFPQLHTWWMTHLTEYAQKLLTNSHWKVKVTPQEFANRITPFATGITVFFFASSIFVVLVISRFWQCVIASTNDFGNEFIRIRIGYIEVLLLCVLIVFCALKKAVAIDILPIALFPFFVSGLSLMHYWARQKEWVVFVLTIAYLSLFFLPEIVVPILSMFALIDAGFNFRGVEKL